MWYDSLTFSIDWINVTVDCPSMSEFLNRLSTVCNLDYSKWVPLERGGLHWYKNSLSYAPAGRSAITLSYCLDQNGNVPVKGDDIIQHGILVSISGDGCRYLDEHSENGLCSLINLCKDYPFNCTRLDAAMDIFDRENPIVPLFSDFAPLAYDYEPGHVMIKGDMQRRPGYVRWIPVWDDDENQFTNNVYIGDRTSSKGHCVVYNKKMEVKMGRLSDLSRIIFDSVGCDDYWYRVEYRAKKREIANAAFVAAGNGSPLDAFFIIADQLFTFVDLCYSINNISKCDENTVWAEFLAFLEGLMQNVHFVQLTAVPYVPASVPRIVNWMKRNAAFIYKIAQMEKYFPEFYRMILDVGDEKHQSFSRYKQFDEEFSRTNVIDAGDGLTFNRHIIQPSFYEYVDREVFY